MFASWCFKWGMERGRDKLGVSRGPKGPPRNPLDGEISEKWCAWGWVSVKIGVQGPMSTGCHPHPTPGSGWQEQDASPGHLHPATAGSPQGQDRAYPGAPCPGRCSEPSFGPTLPPELSTPRPGSSSPMRRQVLQRSPRVGSWDKDPLSFPLFQKMRVNHPRNVCTLSANWY